MEILSKTKNPNRGINIRYVRDDGVVAPYNLIDTDISELGIMLRKMSREIKFTEDESEVVIDIGVDRRAEKESARAEKIKRAETFIDMILDGDKEKALEILISII